MMGLLLSACAEKPTISKTPLIREVIVTPNALTLYEGRYGHLRGMEEDGYGVSLVWTSSDYAVADVWGPDDGWAVWNTWYNCCGETATVKGLKPGTARIYGSWQYTAPEELTGHCDVTVLPVTARRIDISPDTLTVAADSFRWISIFVYDSVGVELRRTLYLRALDPTVATISASELLDLTTVYGHNRGQTYVFAYTDGGLSDSSLVIVE